MIRLSDDAVIFNVTVCELLNGISYSCYLCFFDDHKFHLTFGYSEDLKKFTKNNMPAVELKEKELKMVNESLIKKIDI